MNRIVLSSSFLAPCMFITSLFGTNVYLPGSNTTGVSWFWGIISFIFVMTMLLMIFVRKKLVSIKGRPD